VALCSEVCEVKYLRSLMRELGHKQAESTLTGRTTQRLFSLLTSNTDRRLEVSILMCGYKFVAQAVTEGSVRVRYTPTDMNLADVLTKAVPAATFERLVKLCLDSKRRGILCQSGR